MVIELFSLLSHPCITAVGIRVSYQQSQHVKTRNSHIQLLLICAHSSIVTILFAPFFAIIVGQMLIRRRRGEGLEIKEEKSDHNMDMPIRRSQNYLPQHVACHFYWTIFLFYCIIRLVFLFFRLLRYNVW
jgi:hypothetical protein